MSYDFDPGQFIKCPNCHRTGTAKLVLHIDGDASLECDACETKTIAYKLNQSPRTYQ